MPENLGVPNVDAAGDYYQVGTGGGGLAIGAAPATPVKNLFKVSAAITPGAVGAANASGTEQTFNPAGFAALAVGDVIVGFDYPSTGNASTIARARVSAGGTVALTFNNA